MPSVVVTFAVMQTTETRNPRWLDADEAFRFLRLPSRKALYQAVRRGQVPAHRLGRRLRFSEMELDRLLSRAGID